LIRDLPFPLRHMCAIKVPNWAATRATELMAHSDMSLVVNTVPMM